jgi:hypothetical protein
MIRIRPGSPAALLIASIVAERQAPELSRHINPRRGLTTELPTRVRRPIIIRHAQRAN